MPKEAAPARARAVAQEFALDLKRELAAAIHEGGAVGAIEVCGVRAGELAAAHGAKAGAIVRRATLRPRNPASDPDDWEFRVLGNFAARMRAGTDPKRLEVIEKMVQQDGSRVWRYARAIVIEPLCLTCHGENIIPPVREKLAGSYPDDQATGYKDGELRGILSVTVPADSGP